MRSLTFLLLTFAVTWSIWLLPGVLPSGRTGIFALGGPVFLLGVFAPGLVALALTARVDGIDGVARLLARIGRWRVAWPLYVFALGYMTVTKLAAAGIVRLATGAWPAFGQTPWPLLLAAAVATAWAQAGEEVGWRGYALPRLARRIGLGPAGILLGLVWALWHLPLFFIPGTGSDGQSFPLYLLHVMALSVAMAWLYWRAAGSLLLVMLMHAAVNNTTGIVPAAVPGADNSLSLDGSLVGWITVAVSWLVAVPCLFAMRGVRVGAPLEALDPRPGPRSQ
ncbi:MAG: CPBP family intramembrane metalloprotease [Acidobacteria bacterium]|nr:CPBP family intramembrane metalloprotease [Acidobacteriota bacterium]